MKRTKMIALGGIMSALCIVIMLLGAIIGIGIYAAPMIAGVCLIPVGNKYGKKFHSLLWGIVSVLSLIIVPDVEEGLMFLALFGFYPIIYPYFDRLPRILKLLAKLLYFNVVIIAIESLVIYLLAPEAEEPLMMIILWALGNVTFLLYDAVIPRADRLLDKSIGKLIRKL